MRLLLLRLSLLSVLLLSPTVAVAQDNESLATQLFNEGRDRMAEGRYSDACPKLAESAKLVAAVGTLGKLADCEEHLGQLVRARAHWQQALNVARAQSDSRASLVEAELARVDQLVPKLRLVLEGPIPSDLAIVLDQTQLGAGSLGLAIPLDPGPHRIVVTAPGRKPWNGSVALKADGAVSVLTIAPLESVASLEERRALQPQKETSVTNPARTTGLVVAGVGVVTLGVASYFGGVAKAKLDESNATGCEGNRCSPAAAETRTEGRDAGNVSTVLFLAGGTLLVGGLTLWWALPDSAEKSASRVGASAAVAPGAAGLTFRGAW